MQPLFPAPRPAAGRRHAHRLFLSALVLGLACALASGCAAVSNPIGQGVPVRRLPPEYLASPKDETHLIPQTLLRRQPPDVYRVDAGDILGVYIATVLGEKNQPIPVRFPDLGNATPALGFPVPVREDGTIILPQQPPLLVKGKTLIEIQDLLHKVYTEPKKLIQKENEPLVTLMRPRTIQVLVVRQDSGTLTIGPGGVTGNTRRGTGQVVDLPANENDVINALTRTGGLPGFDAVNEIVIQRGFNNIHAPPSIANAAAPVPGAGAGGQVVRIPLRLREGEPPPFTAEDIQLRQGDIVFIEARDTEVYYVGGLMYPRQFVLPRDYDLSVREAIALAGGPLLNGGTQQNNLSGAIVASGLGSPSPSCVTVLRRTRNRGQIAIRVDLNLAYRDPRENILIQPGDFIVMQETVGEALTRYITTVFRFTYLANLIRHTDFLATSNANLP
jgi:protein involved in polysaccharide export with SLBB domain